MNVITDQKDGPKNSLITSVTVLGLLTWAALASRADAAEGSATALSATSQLNRFTIGAEAGTTGAGGRAEWCFSDHFAVGSAFDYYSCSYSGTIKGNKYRLNLRLMSEPLTLNWYPWARYSFHVSAGPLFNQNHLHGSAGPNFTLNGFPHVGTASLRIKPQPVNAYLAIGGNIYLDRGHHWSLGGELGAIYTGEPRVSLTTTAPAPVVDVQAERDRIKSYAKDAQFWPVLKLSLNYSF